METLVLPPVDSSHKARKEASLPVGSSLRLVTQGCCCWSIYLARAGGSARQLSRGVATRRESCLIAVVTSRFGLGRRGWLTRYQRFNVVAGIGLNECLT